MDLTLADLQEIARSPDGRAFVAEWVADNHPALDFLRRRCVRIAKGRRYHKRLGKATVSLGHIDAVPDSVDYFWAIIRRQALTSSSAPPQAARRRGDAQ